MTLDVATRKKYSKGLQPCLEKWSHPIILNGTYVFMLCGRLQRKADTLPSRSLVTLTASTQVVVFRAAAVSLTQEKVFPSFVLLLVCC